MKSREDLKIEESKEIKKQKPEKFIDNQAALSFVIKALYFPKEGK